MAAKLLARPTKQASRRAYTINDKQDKSFTIQIKSPASPKLTKTTMVAFNNELDAFHMAQLFETHRRMTKEWPQTIFDSDDETPLTIYGDIKPQEILYDLSISEWDTELLRNYCLNNMMDILYITEIEMKNNSKYSVKGDLHRIESADANFYINILNSRFNMD